MSTFPSRVVNTGLRRLFSTSNHQCGSSSVQVENLSAFHVTVITLDRVERRNCIDSTTAITLTETLDKFNEDNEAHVAVFRGRGGNFCAGIDLKEIADHNNAAMWTQETLHNLRSSLERVEKPMVAALSGWSVGLGVELALHCDLRLMDSSSRLAFLNRRFNVPSLLNGCENLSRLIGASHALDLTLSGRIVEAREALALGIVNRVVKEGTVSGEAINTARQIAKFPQEALRLDRKAIRRESNRTRAQQSQHERGEADEEQDGHYSKVYRLFQENAVIAGEKFVRLGQGRGGKFDVNAAVALQDWQEELIAMKNEWLRKQQSLQSPQ